jgi:phosphatidylglycerophosphate synthase
LWQDRGQVKENLGIGSGQKDPCRAMQPLSLAARLVLAIPNALSLSRLALGLGFPWLPAAWRGGVALAAGLTDVFDGLMSRRLHAASATGRILDPVADKVFFLAVVATLLVEGGLQLWEAVLVGLRDVMVLAGAGWVFVRQGWSAFRRMPSTLLGKATTAAQFVFLLVLLFRPQQRLVVFLPTVLLSGLAAADYLRMFLLSFSREPPASAGAARSPEARG